MGSNDDEPRRLTATEEALADKLDAYIGSNVSLRDAMLADSKQRMAEADKRDWRALLQLIANLLIAVALVLLFVLRYQGSKTQEYLVDCTTPGKHVPTAAEPYTGHSCFDDGQVRTGAYVTQLSSDIRLSLDCIESARRTGTTTPVCAAVEGRLKAVTDNRNPFAPSTTGLPSG